MGKIDVRGLDPPDAPIHHGKGPEKSSRMVWEDGERRACKEWEADLYGVGERGLGRKRRGRGWGMGGGEGLVWEGEGECVRALMAWKGGDDGREVFPGSLPWEED